MTKGKKKKKKKKVQPQLSREEFAFLCELILAGSDVALEDLWDDMRDLEDATPNDNPFQEPDDLLDMEIQLFAKVDKVLYAVCKKFGYAEPLSSKDVFALDDKPKQATPDVVKPIPLPKLVMGKAPTVGLSLPQ